VEAFVTLRSHARKKHIATVGQPIAAELQLKLVASGMDGLEADFEVVVPTDSWLVGGRRKGSISLTRQPTTIAIVLFPQHPGYLLLPTVTVRCRRLQGKSDNDRKSWTTVNCDIYNPTQGMTVLVTPDLSSTTIEAFGPVLDDGTGRLLASERRK
jgi:hypothetical protein